MQPLLPHNAGHRLGRVWLGLQGAWMLQTAVPAKNDFGLGTRAVLPTHPTMHRNTHLMLDWHHELNSGSDIDVALNTMPTMAIIAEASTHSFRCQPAGTIMTISSLKQSSKCEGCIHIHLWPIFILPSAECMKDAQIPCKAKEHLFWRDDDCS